MANKDKPIKKWVADAIEIDISTIEGMVYTNEWINSFLEQDNWLFLSANKGMGKTLLMSFKRYLASQEHSSAIFIPRNKPFLDNMDIIKTKNKKMEDFMVEQSVTVQMWLFSFQISILSHLKFSFSEGDLEVLRTNLPASFFQYITNRELTVNPTDIFRELLLGSPNDLMRILKHSSPLDSAVKQVRSEVRVFIDRVDQALPEVSQKTWTIIQGSLIDAAWSVYNSNNHIKIYATIRQEAYANYSSPTMANVMVFELSYSKKELLDILDKLARFYEGKNSFNEFIAPVTTANTVGVDEAFVDFLIRHTLHRPRDVVKICAAISLAKSRETAAAEETVVDTANNQVIPHIFSESNVFLDCLKHENQRKDILSLMTQNILSYTDIVEIFAKANSLDRNVIGQLELQNSKYYHPFSELYKIGLLGIVTSKNVQRFRMPKDPQNFHTFELPESQHYILHPALRNYMGIVNANNYNVFQYIVTGHNLEWNEPVNEYLIAIQSKLFKLYDLKIKNTFLRTIGKNFLFVRQNYVLPAGSDLTVCENLLDEFINRETDDAKLECAMDLMEIIQKSKTIPVRT